MSVGREPAGGIDVGPRSIGQRAATALAAAADDDAPLRLSS
jgi:hypothetical protein